MERAPRSSGSRVARLGAAAQGTGRKERDGDVPMHGPGRRAAAAWERRAQEAAVLVRRVVEEPCNPGDLAVLDEILAPPATGAPLNPGGASSDIGCDAPVRADLP